MAAVSAAPAQADAATTPLRAPFTDARLTTHHTAKCLDVAAASPDNGAMVQQWDCYSDRTNQEWDFISTTDGYYTVRARHSGKCLDVAEASTAEGGIVHQWECVEEQPGRFRMNQQWRLAQRPNGYFALVARHSGKCLEVLNADVANGAQVVQATCAEGRPQQEWALS
ncbi:RICIN domain-containing protein [Streptomonospora sp. S1-112]|uniref:RICIN domain-containing protein n=1 Tax=Streptomonospora mangrovi TaxID=2883123 RepID=A0A9X3NSP3_9ACTN|nr:RICIN domain-containing protein [Streptomonospora mangrovi]MDA0563436.1 RICIN domain-containing protein [Streptomonospora mangrovi]